MTDIIKIIAIAAIAIVLITIIKKNNSEYSLFVEITTIIVIIAFVINSCENIIEYIYNLSNNYKIEVGYIGIILKAIGISFLVEVGSNICKDSGNLAIASKVEFAGKIAILLLTIPLLEKITEFTVGIING